MALHTIKEIRRLFQMGKSVLNGCFRFGNRWFVLSAPFHFVPAVHKDISERLPQFNRALYLQVKEVLDINKAQRHIRGGIATRKKYRGV